VGESSFLTMPGVQPGRDRSPESCQILFGRALRSYASSGRFHSSLRQTVDTKIMFIFLKHALSCNRKPSMCVWVSNRPIR
jgi:hypothetical protein